ncbi:MAG: hypothetical protein QM784_25295 [Polyangiaceae bacterium]
MRFEDALDRLPDAMSTPRDRLLAALAMYDEGVSMQRSSIRRRFPNLSEQEVEKRLASWLAREDEAP